METTLTRAQKFINDFHNDYPSDRALTEEIAYRWRTLTPTHIASLTIPPRAHEPANIHATEQPPEAPAVLHDAREPVDVMGRCRKWITGRAWDETLSADLAAEELVAIARRAELDMDPASLAVLLEDWTTERRQRYPDANGTVLDLVSKRAEVPQSA